jgi:outer membrane receptor protein involved in Fe transport
MNRTLLRTCASVLAIGAAGFAMPAFAADKDAAKETDTLDTIVVTASTGTRSKLDSSVSVSSVDAAVINDFHPMSEGDLLRLLPGLQPNISGPGGNGNFAVRGLPVATGGAPFVQLQEDGLPMVLYGDMQFGNNDYWTKSSPTDERVEAIRGGTVATLASQAPGAVVNYVSKTSRSEGGFVELEKGVNYDYTKVKFMDSGIINDSMYYNVGGFYDVGHGPRHASYNVSNSWLIKGNITKEFADNKGYIRVLFKASDTAEPNDTGGPICGNISGSSVSGLKACPGFDVRNQSNYSINNANVSYIDFNSGGLAQVPLAGITTKEKALQLQLHYKFENGMTLDDNGRYAVMSGGFASNFFSTAPVSGLLGSTVNGQVVARAVYAAGPNKGQNVAETYYDNNVQVYTRIRSVDSIANDLKLNWKGDLGGSLKANLTAGWFFMSQNIAMDWHPGQFNSQASGSDASPIALLNAAGNLISAGGAYGYNNNWGSCCARTYDYTFSDNAPYVDLILDSGKFELDASLRDDINHGSGSGTASTGHVYTLNQTAVNPVTGAANTVAIPYFLPDGAPEVLNYDKSLLSWSVGASYKPADNTNLFLRASRGTRFNSDRLSFGGNFDANGKLTTAGQTAVSDIVYQYEAGVKNRGSIGEARYTAELTLFYSHFNVFTYELNPLVCVPLGFSGGTCPIADKYKTTGVEFAGTLHYGGLSLLANVTYNKSKKAAGGSTVFSPSDHISDLTYSLAANYRLTDTVSAGFDVAGVSGQYDGFPTGNKWPGSAVVGANLKFAPVKNLQFGINVYNLLNSFAAQGAGSITAATGGTFYGGASVANGRSVTGSVKFSF